MAVVRETVSLTLKESLMERFWDRGLVVLSEATTVSLMLRALVLC